VELLLVVTLVGIVAAATVPPLTSALDEARTRAAARFVHARLSLARSQAAARGSVVAIRFTGTPEWVNVAAFVDGNRDGVRTEDIGNGIDVGIDQALTLQSAFRGVRLEPLKADGVLFSFTPVGTSSSGTLYLTGSEGSRFAVRVLGATGRTRMLHFANDEWTYLE
jgi:type II secretory pathway pseudopilin PulG